MAFTREKALDIIKKLLAQAKDEKEIQGNFGAGEMFEDKAKDLMQKYSISQTEIDRIIIDASQPVFVNELGKSIISNPFLRVNAKNNLRKLWFEELAILVAEAYYCKLDVNLEDGSVYFYGYDLDRELATFMFLKLTEQANELCKQQLSVLKSQVGKQSGFDIKTRRVTSYPKVWMGDDTFIDSFHLGFRESLTKIYLNHKLDDVAKLEAVSKFFEENKNTKAYGYYYSYRQQNQPKATELNESAQELGRICGFNIAKKATKNPSALTVKASKLESKNIVYILMDVSNSMWGDKLLEAKTGAISYAKQATREKGFQVGLITFGSEPSFRLKPQSEVDEKFENIVNKVETSGGTNLADALRMVQGRFLSRNSKRVIMIITDGNPTSWNHNPKEECLRIAKDIKRAGIEIQCIGTYDCDKNFIDALVSREGLGLLVDNSRLALGVGQMAANL